MQKGVRKNREFTRGVKIFSAVGMSLYILLILLIEGKVFDFVFILSPIRFLVYAFFAAAGGLVGINDNNRKDFRE